MVLEGGAALADEDPWLHPRHPERPPLGVRLLPCRPAAAARRSSSKSSRRPDLGGRIDSTVRAVSLTVDIDDSTRETLIESQRVLGVTPG